ncbi:MAG: calcium/sodium antiporter [Anaerolineae bacterium]
MTGSLVLSLVFIGVGLGLLVWGGDWLVESASRLAARLGVPSLVIGLTVVAFGTSAPELGVSLSAALEGSPGIAIGNVIGSNIANIGLILGLSGLIVPLTANARLVKLEIPVMIGVSLLVFFFSFDGTISRLEGIILLVGIVIFNGGLFLLERANPQEKPEKAAADEEKPINPSIEALRLVFSVGLLVAGSELLVSGATDIAVAAGISEFIIGLTLVAFGTSLPELAASISAAVQGETDIAVGNVIGSNISNLLLILGVTALARPIPVAMASVQLEFAVMIGFSLLLIPFALNRRLGRPEALFFLISYTVFIASAFIVNA